jgi:3-carboxy-cis,cis-muconate cycloisomerase
MRRNLDRRGGVELAERITLELAPSLGREEARKRVEQAVVAATARDAGVTFAAALLADPAIAGVLDAERVAELLDPAGYLGSADLWIDRTLAAHRERRL